VSWYHIIAAAKAVRERLAEAGLESFVKTTGGKGLHVVVPLKPAADWDAVKAFTQRLAEGMAKREPDKYTASVAKKLRSGRIFVDYLRNTRGATAIAAYGTRARAGAPVSTPLTWDELSETLDPARFTLLTVPTRLGHLREDPWAGLDEIEQALPDMPQRGRRAGKR
jgi:bifunctional non-homologous end joining protein LigD